MELTPIVTGVGSKLFIMKKYTIKVTLQFDGENQYGNVEALVADTIACINLDLQRTSLPTAPQIITEGYELVSVEDSEVA